MEVRHIGRKGFMLVRQFDSARAAADLSPQPVNDARVSYGDQPRSERTAWIVVCRVARTVSSTSSTVGGDRMRGGGGMLPGTGGNCRNVECRHQHQVFVLRVDDAKD